MADEHRACGNCEFWEEVYDIGICRRHAPKPTLSCLTTSDEEDTSPTSHAVWPATAEGDWCGEFSPEARTYANKK